MRGFTVQYCIDVVVEINSIFILPLLFVLLNISVSCDVYHTSFHFSLCADKFD